MKAIQIQQVGGPDVLRYVDLVEPVPRADQIRVRAQVIGVGKPDALIRRGVYAWMPPLPAIPGNELAGIVDAVGAEVKNIAIGSRVLVSSRELAQRGGCYAEAICVPADAAYPLPAQVSAATAVCLANYQLAGALLYESGVRRPSSILVHGAAGGVATALLQLAQADGLLAIGTASSAEKCNFARAYGARHIIDRSRDDVHAQVMALTQGQGVDVVLDHMGGPDFSRNLELLAPCGTLMSYNALAGLPPDNLLGALRAVAGKALGIRCYSIHLLDSVPSVRRALMQRAIELAAAEKICPPAPTILPLSEAARAHTLLDSGTVLGKLALVPEQR